MRMKIATSEGRGAPETYLLMRLQGSMVTLSHLPDTFSPLDL